MKHFAFCLAVFALLSLTAFAVEDDQLPGDFLSNKHSLHPNNAGGLHGKGNIPTPHGFPLGVDTVVNFTGHFEAQSFFWDGTPHHIWEYSFVGNPPEFGGTTMINAPVIPVVLDLRNADGSPRFVNGQPLISRPDAFLHNFMNGPVFNVAQFSSSPDPTQVTDAEQRATFGNQARADWHTLLVPSVKTSRTMVLLKALIGLRSMPMEPAACMFL